MKTLIAIVGLSGMLIVQAQAEWKQCSNTNAIPTLLGTNEFSWVLQSPVNKLTTDQKAIFDTITESKVPNKEAARKILAERSESAKWMGSAISFVFDRGLRQINRDISDFGKKGDFVWVIEVQMGQHIFHGVFLVNTRNGELLRLP